jgi:hypothetical protein
MDFSQMQTPPPTRDATSRRGLQNSAGNQDATPATVIRRTPNQMPTTGAMLNQTPFGFSGLQFSPDMMPFANAEPISASAMPQSRLFWDQPNGITHMDVDMPLDADPFGPTPQKLDNSLNWHSFQTPMFDQMNSHVFQPLQSMSSADPLASFGTVTAEEDRSSRPGSFASTTAGVDPSMLFSFSDPDMTSSFGTMPQQTNRNAGSRQPYETQMLDSRREREMAKKPKSQHSRSNTNSSSGSVENKKPTLQRSNTDSGFRKSRPSTTESRSSSGAVAPHHIPRRSSPLKRQNSGSLKSIPEIRRPRTRLIIDETGRARTETVSPDDEDATPRVVRKSSHTSKQQYPALWEEGDTESDDEPPPVLSRNASFNIPQPQRRASKQARIEGNDLPRSNVLNLARPRMASSAFDKASFDSVRPVKRPVDNNARRFSMMDMPTSFDDIQKHKHQQVPDSPGDALGALKKMVAGRQQRTGMAS